VLREAIGHCLWPVAHAVPRAGRGGGAVRTALGEGFATAWATDRALLLEQTIADAGQIGEPGTPAGAMAR
jgi:hypothetical protein